jgi:hypothetical protein
MNIFKRKSVDTPNTTRSKLFRLVRNVLLFLSVWLVFAYFLLPVACRFIPRQHPALDDMPRITRTKHGFSGDPINIALIGTDEEIVSAMLKSNWLPADPITMRSSLRIVERTVRSLPYETAPVSNLFIWDRRQDLTFQLPIGKNPKRRHHVRFWRSENLEDDGRPLWIGAATLDINVGLSRTTAQITHHIDANIDAERNKLMDDLDNNNVAVKTEWIDNFHTQLKGRNGSGDRWYTDERLPVLTLKSEIHATLDI